LAEIINLRMARKARARRIAQTQAEAARAKHGQTKATRTATQQTSARIARIVDGAKLAGDNGETD